MLIVVSVVLLHEINTVPVTGTAVKVATVRLQLCVVFSILGTRSLALFEPVRIHKLNPSDHNRIEHAFGLIN